MKDLRGQNEGLLDMIRSSHFGRPIAGMSLTGTGDTMNPSTRISRRKLLGTAAAAGVHLSLNRSGAGASQRPGPREFFDVAIVGAGLAGLTAARALTKSGINRIVVFDARDRVGGRTVNHDIGGGRVLGGGGGGGGAASNVHL